MKAKFIFAVLVCLIFTFIPSVYCQNYSLKFKAFTIGEVLEYDVVYNWGVIWVSAGHVSFSVKKAEVKEKSLYHFIGEGHSKKNWDWFFKVRDKFESYNDTTTLHPFKYIRNCNDGGEWVYNDVTFDQKNKRAIGYIKTRKHPELKIDTMAINYLSFDPITMIYYARCIDYEQYAPKSEIPITLLLDNKVYYRKMIYLGKETITTDYGTTQCIKFTATLIPGTMFKDGDAMTVWVTDDGNRIPVKVETPIVVGSVKVFLKKAEGLKYISVK